MAKTKDAVEDYIASCRKVMEHFRCEDDFFIKPLIDLEWAIEDKKDFHFLSYWEPNGQRQEAVVVPKQGRPMIFQMGKYTMVVAIDCLKIAFLFLTEKKRA